MVDIPNKCDICGLKTRVIEKQGNSESEIYFKKLNELKDARLVDIKHSRNIVMFANSEDPSFFDYCSVDSKSWNNRAEKCEWLQFKHADLKLPDYISLYHSIKNAKTARNLTKTAIWISSIFSLVIVGNIIFQICSASN